MVVLLATRKSEYGKSSSACLPLSAVVGGIGILCWAAFQLFLISKSSLRSIAHLHLGAIDDAAANDASSFRTGALDSSKILYNLPPAPRRRLGEGRSLGGGSTFANSDTDGTNVTAPFHLALLRPFAPHDASDLVESFVEWKELTPCDADAWFRSGSVSAKSEVDLFLSISQTFSSHPVARELIDRVVNNDLDPSSFGHSSWNVCFGSIHVIEASISPDVDRYGVSSPDQTDDLWVNGPNEHFIRSIRQIQAMNAPYDAVLLMEADVHPWKEHWLDLIMEEVAEKQPFSILGSENHGMIWRQNRDDMPIPLRHHLTGNSVFNLTDPFFNRFVEELEAESETFYRAIPYDYRLSQMFYEASMGVKPDFPFRKMKDGHGKDVILPDKTAIFRGLWLGVVRAGREDSIIKESSSIDNFGGTNYVAQQVSSRAAVVHGKLHRDNWNGTAHPMTLVLLEASSDRSTFHRILGDLDSLADHPFAEAVVLVQGASSLSKAKINPKKGSPSIAVSVHYLTHDYSIDADLCQIIGAISNEWFVVVSSTDRVASRQMHFPVSRSNQDAAVPVPVVPFITDNDQRTSRNGTDDRKLILDNELVFHRDIYQSFCKSRDTAANGGDRIDQSLATRFIAYLGSIGIVDAVYVFSNKALHGAFENFITADEGTHLANNFANDGNDKETSSRVAIQRALKVLAEKRAKSRSSQYPTTKGTEQTKKTRRSKKKGRNLMLGIQMEGLQYKSDQLFGDKTIALRTRTVPAGHGITDAASSRYPGIARFHIYQIAKIGGEEYSALLTCILQGLLEPDELHALIPDEEMTADATSFGPRPDGIQDVSYPLLFYNGELMHSRDNIGNTLVSQVSHETNVDSLTQAFGDLFQRNIYVAVHSTSSEANDLAVEERFCVRTNVVCIDHDDFTYSNDDELVEGIEKVASILISQIPLFARIPMGIGAATNRVKLMEDVALEMNEQPQSARDLMFGLVGGQPLEDTETESGRSDNVDVEPFHIFQVAKPHTGSTLLNAILQGFFDLENSSYSFLPKRPPGQDDLRFGPYPLGVKEDDIAEISLPFIVHEGRLKLSRDHLSSTVVTKTHVVDIDLLENVFGRQFEHTFYVVANRAEKDISIEERYCAYSNVLCVDYDEFAYSPDSSSSEEIMGVVNRIKMAFLDKFALPDDIPMDTQRALGRVKKMEKATEGMASKTFDEVENTFGIHGGHRNRGDKPARQVKGDIKDDDGAADNARPNVVHLFSPYRLETCDFPYCPYDQAQSVAIASMLHAASHATMASVTLAATAFADESDIVIPDDFMRLDPLLRSTRSEFPEFISDKKLPFIADIFENLKVHRDFSTFDYVIYTNSDIILHERFYDVVALAIEHGHDSFTINRQTVSVAGEDGVLFSAVDLDRIFALEGNEHPGSDCFVIRREIFERLKLGDLYLGFPPFANFILFQLEALAENYRVFESNELKATYHLGDDQSWREDDEGSLELYTHQYHYAVEDLLPLWSSFCLFDWRSESGNSAACTHVVKKFRKYAKTNIDGGIEAVEKMYNERSSATTGSAVPIPHPNLDISTRDESLEATPPKPLASSNSKKIAFQFLIGVEGTGHHLHRTMYLSSPVGEWLASNSIDEDVVNLSLALWDRGNTAGAIWSAPCSNANADEADGDWWKVEENGPEGGVLFDTLVERLRVVEKKIEESLAKDPSSTFPAEQPIVVAINGGLAGNAKGERRVSPYMSYPMLGGPCRALQYPSIDILYRACDVAGVRCQHSVVIRDPYRVLRSTSMNRHFASRHVQLTTLASMQHIVLSQMMVYPDRLMACWEADTETPTELGQLFGWTDPAEFKDAYNNLFIVPSPITADDKKEITKDDHLKVYMDGMVASNNRIKELCFQQLEINQSAEASTQK